MELEAYFLAALYMRWRSNNEWTWRKFIWILTSIGDFHFNSPAHHGTPAQRCRAGVAGVTTAGIQVPWSILHSEYNRFYSDGTILSGKSGFGSTWCSAAALGEARDKKTQPIQMGRRLP